MTDLETTLKNLLDQYGKDWSKHNAPDTIWKYIAEHLPNSKWMRSQLGQAWHAGLIWRRPNKNTPGYANENPYKDGAEDLIREYRVKTPTVEAIHWSGSSKQALAVVSWILDKDHSAYYIPEDETTEKCIKIKDTGRFLTVYPNDYVVRNPDAGFYPLSSKQFQQRFELR